ncbi:hypothetical protein LL14B4_06050 [Lactococcus lactis subsp. lactis]|uniref:Uncharacterized protein n=1 Tax=Lactococcus lactis subsp. lactis TaxID=1360 RepID=A0A2Z3KDJ0_LACLL|nr:hypothetical protein [Lactococcus lactis]AWN65762.1 hypothetical protein LL14B4_06050 [Lactococcus lactis subsp. lactis]
MIELNKKERKYLYKLASSEEIINFDKNNVYQEVLIDRGLVKTKPYIDDSDPAHKKVLRPRIVPTTEGARYKRIYRENWRKEFFKNLFWPITVAILANTIGFALQYWLVR